MLITVRGKNLELDEALIAYVQRKFERLERYVNNLQRAEVELSHEPTREVEGRQVAVANLIGNRLLIHGEERAGEVHAAIDALADTMRRRLQRLKSTRQTQRHRAPGAKGIAAEAVPAVPPTQAETAESDHPAA